MAFLRCYIHRSSPRGATSAYHRMFVFTPLRLTQTANSTYCYLFGFSSNTAYHRCCLANATTSAHRPRRANKATETPSRRHCIKQSTTRTDRHKICLPPSPSCLLPTARLRSSQAVGQLSWRTVAPPTLIVSYAHIFQSRTFQNHCTGGTDWVRKEFLLDLWRAMEFLSSIDRISRIWFAGARTWRRGWQPTQSCRTDSISRMGESNSLWMCRWSIAGLRSENVISPRRLRLPRQCGRYHSGLGLRAMRTAYSRRPRTWSSWNPGSLRIDGMVDLQRARRVSVCNCRLSRTNDAQNSLVRGIRVLRANHRDPVPRGRDRSAAAKGVTILWAASRRRSHALRSRLFLCTRGNEIHSSAPGESLSGTTAASVLPRLAVAAYEPLKCVDLANIVSMAGTCKANTIIDGIGNLCPEISMFGPKDCETDSHELPTTQDSLRLGRYRLATMLSRQTSVLSS